MIQKESTSVVDDKAYQRLKTVWERNWARADFKPSWPATEIPQELNEAIESGWFPAQATLLDIGCGDGILSAWLAEQGFDVLGIDFSPSVIDRNRQRWEQASRKLAFAVADICVDRPSESRFQLLFDRGCLQGLPKAFHPEYAKTIAAWAQPGAHFLLLCGYNQQARRSVAEEYEMQKAMEAHLHTHFRPYFTIHKMTPTFLEREAPHEPVPTLAVWMARHHS